MPSGRSAILRQPAITVAAGVTEAAVLHLRSLVARLRLANREFHQAERKLNELCTTLRESTTAAGRCAARRSHSEFAARDRHGHPRDLAHRGCRADQPPRLRCPQDPLRRGARNQAQRQELHRHMRYAAQVRLRNAVFHWARVAVLNDPKCRSRYAALRARGHSYGRALRGVADRLLGVACVLLQRQVLFDPDYGSSAAA